MVTSVKILLIWEKKTHKGNKCDFFPLSETVKWNCFQINAVSNFQFKL